MGDGRHDLVQLQLRDEPVNVADFYGPDYVGNRFAVMGPYYGPLGHRGVDFNGHAIRTPIPSWCAGRVALITFYSLLGQVVIVERDEGGFAGYCHLTIDPPVQQGQRIEVGDTVGLLGNTGSATTGPHLHATFEPYLTIGTGFAMDPLPHIEAARVRIAPTVGVQTPITGDDMGDALLLKVDGEDAVYMIGGGYRTKFDTAGALERAIAVHKAANRPLPEVVSVPTFAAVRVLWDAVPVASKGMSSDEVQVAVRAALDEAQVSLTASARFALTDAVERRLTPKLDSINANIDNQPTEFTVTPK